MNEYEMQALRFDKLWAQLHSLSGRSARKVIVDKFTPAQRSKIMSAIHSRDTLPEVVVRKWLYANGYRFRTCDKRIVGHPDIVLPRLKTLIEIRGCFWHHHGWIWDGRKLVQKEACAQATAPKTNRAFWNAKFRRNVQRDQEHMKLWSEQGWNVIVIWECALKTIAEREKTFAKVAKWLGEFADDSTKKK